MDFVWASVGILFLREVFINRSENVGFSEFLSLGTLKSMHRASEGQGGLWRKLTDVI